MFLVPFFWKTKTKKMFSDYTCLPETIKQLIVSYLPLSNQDSAFFCGKLQNPSFLLFRFLERNNVSAIKWFLHSFDVSSSDTTLLLRRAAKCNTLSIIHFLFKQQDPYQQHMCLYFLAKYRHSSTFKKQFLKKETHNLRELQKYYQAATYSGCLEILYFLNLDIKQSLCNCKKFQIACYRIACKRDHVPVLQYFDKNWTFFSPQKRRMFYYIAVNNKSTNVMEYLVNKWPFLCTPEGCKFFAKINGRLGFFERFILINKMKWKIPAF